MTDFDPVAFGRDMGAMFREMLEPLAKRLEELEGRDVVKELLSTDRVETLIDVAVSAHLEANPPPAGKDADPISEDAIGEQVAKYLKANPVKEGADGVGLAGAMIDRGGELVITTTKGEAIRLGKVVGEDGEDGLSFEDVAGEYVPEKGFVLTISKGQRKAEFVLPYMTHKGFWREGMAVKAAESITHDGALWIAKRDNTTKPCMENADDWQLAARKGRDGKDGQKVYVESNPVKLGADNAA